LAPVGAIGEIWIAGAQVADGYIGEENVDNKFVENPFDNDKNFRRVFRTGDYGRWREDGNLEFLGRRDNLVKIRGFRVEIGEIEYALKTLEGVADAAVATWKDAADSLQISAYVVSKSKLNLADIRQKLSLKLPPQMMPQSLQQIEALPTTPNGKIDRKHLPPPVWQKSSQPIIPPKNDLEVAICKAFADVLNVAEVSADANFFEMGGTSISAMQVVVNLENSGIKIKYADIFEHPTPQQLAAVNTGESGNTEEHENAGLRARKKLNGRHGDLQSLPAMSRGEALQSADIILTGVTGFFGAHLLKELLKSPKNKICCVVRSKDGDTAEERLLKITAHYFGKSMVDEYADRIKIIDGDIANSQVFSELEYVVSPKTTVINCAAIVKHFAEKKRLQAVNVDAVKYLIDCCKRHDCRLVHISTLSAAVKAGEVVYENTVCPLPPDAVPYVASKWQAEQLALDAATNGLKLNIIRLGNLAPRSSDGMFQINADDNAIMNLIGAVKQLGCYPESLANIRFDFTPVDHAARDVARLIAVASYPAVYHVFDANKVAVNEIVDAQKVSDAEFLQRVRQLPLRQRIFMEYFSAANLCEWDNKWSNSVLEGVTIPNCPYRDCDK
ncbi:MAG: SDR family oxidoreductase, partial [Bacteroidales bacterium]|nr:SDR family oxidoreductase [Bacteroidales bacterium]